jgi:phosphoribosylamine--glycine ligase/phosphoribosylformylglycinamidine cyclo-ligase
MLDKEFGNAGDEVVIEEFLEGDELSILSFSDGHTIKSLPPAQDHKRIGEGDTGPNTGGMGTYAPTRIAPKDVLERIDKDILQPTIDGMRSEGYIFKGVLFTGLMMTKDGAKVLEYNVRFGDPETQSLLALMESDLADVMLACADGKLKDVDVKVSDRSAATVVMAAGGYPGSYKKGTEMSFRPPPEGSYSSPLRFRSVMFFESRANHNNRRRSFPRRHLLLRSRREMHDVRRACYCVDGYWGNARRSG